VAEEGEESERQGLGGHSPPLRRGSGVGGHAEEHGVVEPVRRAFRQADALGTIRFGRFVARQRAVRHIRSLPPAADDAVSVGQQENLFGQ